MTRLPTPNVDERNVHTLGGGSIAAGVEARPFQKLLQRRYRAISVADIDLSVLRELAERPDRPLEDQRSTTVKNGRSAFVVRTWLAANHHEIAAAYKRARAGTWFKRFLRSVRTDRSLRNFVLGHELLRLGIPTSRPLLALSPRLGLRLRPSYLATEWIEHAGQLDTFVRRLSHASADHRRRILRSAAARVGDLIGRMHANGLAHRDLKAANLLVRECGDQVEVYVIDLDGASRPPILFRQMRLTNLARLLRATCPLKEVTHSARLRTLRAYLAHCPERDWKRTWRRLARILQIRQARDAH